MNSAIFSDPTIPDPRPPVPPRGRPPEYGYLAAFLFGSAMTLLAASGGVMLQRVVRPHVVASPPTEFFALPTCQERVEECPSLTEGAR